MTVQHQLPCVVCRNTSWHIDAKATNITRVRNGFTIVRCSSCGLRRLDPMPSQDELRTFYEDDSLKHDYIRNNLSAYVAGIEKAEDYIPHRLKTIAAKRGGVGRILDIGSAQGAFLNRAIGLGWEGAGLELSTEGVRAAQDQGLLVQQKTLHEAQFPPESFDVVHMSHVLEHLPDPLESLSEIRRILKPGGIVAIEVPNEFDDMFANLRETFLRRPLPVNVVPSPHVYFYTPSALKRLLQGAGFDVFHHATPRRNAATASTFPLGGFVRSGVFKAEKALLQGPLIETYAVKTGD